MYCEIRIIIKETFPDDYLESLRNHFNRRTFDDSTVIKMTRLRDSVDSFLGMSPFTCCNISDHIFVAVLDTPDTLKIHIEAKPTNDIKNLKNGIEEISAQFEKTIEDSGLEIEDFVGTIVVEEANHEKVRKKSLKESFKALFKESLFEKIVSLILIPGIILGISFFAEMPWQTRLIVFIGSICALIVWLFGKLLIDFRWASPYYYKEVS